MFKKILVVSLCVCFFGVEAKDISFNGPINLEKNSVSSVPVDTYAGQFLGWLMTGDNTGIKTAVAGLLTYCIAYTLYQTARGIGSTAWTWWKGEKLSPAMQRQVEITVAELIRKNGMGQMAIYRNPHHHEGGTCTCADCLTSLRTRQ